MSSNLRGERLLALLEERKQAALDERRDFHLRDFAGELGLTYKQLENKLMIARKNNEAWQKRRFQPAPALFDLLNLEFGSPWELSGDWLVTGDVHVPSTDYDFAQRVNLIGQRYLKRPRRLLIAGDFFNMDSFSTYEQVAMRPTWAEERDAARHLLDLWLDTFDEVRMLMGNHDRRLQKFLSGAFDETDLLALLKSNPERVKMSNFGHCTIQTPNGPWRVTHPKNYSQNQLTVAEKLAHKFQSHIISLHEHHLAVGWDRFKKYLIVNCGTLADVSKLAYVQMDDSTSAGMAQGFVTLRDGYPYLWGSDQFTDYSKWL